MWRKSELLENLLAGLFTLAHPALVIAGLVTLAQAAWFYGFELLIWLVS